MHRIVTLLATFFYTGYSPIAPGTAGTLAGVVLFWLLKGLTLPQYLLFLAAFIALAIWSADKAETLFGEKDPRQIVIDEAAGFLIVMAGHAWSWKTASIAFVLFRFFDIVKPFPIRRIETRFANGIGIVLDDVVAGIYSAIVLKCVSAWVLGS